MDLEELARQLAGESGNVVRILGILQERQRLQGQLSESQVQVESLRSQLPTAEDAEQVRQRDSLLAQFSEIGTLEEVQTRLAEVELLRGKLNSEQRQGRIRQAADAVSYNPTVLGRLLTDELDVQIDGDAVSVISGEQSTPLSDYATEHWADFLPALQPQQIGTTGSGTQWIPQPPANITTGPTSLITQLLETNQQQAAQGNALTRRLTTRSQNNGTH